MAAKPFLQWSAILALHSALNLSLPTVQAQSTTISYTNWTGLITNWTQTGASSSSWHPLACSADGTKLAAGIDDGGIYTSTNSGVNWIQTSAPQAFWYAM